MRSLSGYGIVSEMPYVSPDADLVDATAPLRPRRLTQRLLPLVMDEVGMSESVYVQERAQKLRVSQLADILRINMKVIDLLKRLYSRTDDASFFNHFNWRIFLLFSPRIF